jgi:hypothetical protein
MQRQLGRKAAQGNNKRLSLSNRLHWCRIAIRRFWSSGRVPNCLIASSMALAASGAFFPGRSFGCGVVFAGAQVRLVKRLLAFHHHPVAAAHRREVIRYGAVLNAAAWATSMPHAETSNQPKNSIETIVAATERPMATTPNNN